MWVVDLHLQKFGLGEDNWEQGYRRIWEIAETLAFRNQDEKHAIYSFFVSGVHQRIPCNNKFVLQKISSGKLIERNHSDERQIKLQNVKRYDTYHFVKWLKDKRKKDFSWSYCATHSHKFDILSLFVSTN